MRLLVVDDEYYTRQGLLTEIDFASLGIDQVFEADDGVNGLELARTVSPQIVLTDVRMPRMNGVKMALELRQEFPDCQVIFMSGYADKEYLKAAIDLKAVSYIEKPFPMETMISTLRKAVESYEKEVHHQRLLSADRTSQRTELVNLLLDAPEEGARIQELLFLLGYQRSDKLVAFVVRPEKAGAAHETSTEAQFSEALIRGKLSGIWTRTAEQWRGVVLAGPERSGSDLEQASFRQLKPVFSPAEGFEAGLGMSFGSLAEGPLAWESALRALDATFFRRTGQLGRDRVPPTPEFFLDPGWTDEFRMRLDQEDWSGSRQWIEQCLNWALDSGTQRSQSVRQFLSRIAIWIEIFAEQRHLPPLEAFETSPSSFSSLQDGKLRLESALADLERALGERREDGWLVNNVKQLIRKNYAELCFSMESISATLRLSESYVSRLFKKATGNTVNAYLTDHRIEQAKRLLGQNEPLTMGEIACRVGYADANYFARVFRKATGQTPSQYRQRILE